MTQLDISYQRSLPAPLCNETFALFKQGVFDDPTIDVYLNDAHDFAVLSPPPTVDYGSYLPRVQKLGLGAYKVRRKYERIRGTRATDDFNAVTLAQPPRT